MAKAKQAAKWEYDFTLVEKVVAAGDRGALDVWVKATTAYAVESVRCKQVTGKTLSVRQFADAWQAQFTTRSAETVRSNIRLVQWAINSGYDIDSFVSREHIIEVQAAANGKPAAKKPQPRVSVSIKPNARIADIDKAIAALVAAKKELLKKSK